MEPAFRSSARMPTEYGNDPVNWKTGAPTAGRDNCPDVADSDGDGLPDSWEIANGLRPDSAVGDDGASGDPDRDGLTNLQEYLSGTDPKSAGSALRIETVNWTETEFKLSFTAVAGKSYTVQCRDSLSEASGSSCTTSTSNRSHSGWRLRTQPCRASTEDTTVW
jgi:hypothetical protein